MKKDEIEVLIDKKIRQHESRVGWISGIIGLFLLFGNFHAFWLMRLWMS